MCRVALYFSILSLAVLLTGCKKHSQLEICEKNCKTYRIQGRIYDATSQKGFGFTPVKLLWKSFRGNCIFCPKQRNDIYRGLADRDGRFSFAFTIDTSLFEDYSLYLYVPEKKGYFETFAGYIGGSAFRDDTPIDIAYYPKAKLTIHIRRTTGSVFDQMLINHTWTPISNIHGYFTSDYNGPEPAGGDTSIVVKTSAAIATIVQVSTFKDRNLVESITDSIICDARKDNVIFINY